MTPDADQSLLHVAAPGVVCVHDLEQDVEVQLTWQEAMRWSVGLMFGGMKAANEAGISQADQRAFHQMAWMDAQIQWSREPGEPG